MDKRSSKFVIARFVDASGMINVLGPGLTTLDISNNQEFVSCIFESIQSWGKGANIFQEAGWHDVSIRSLQLYI